MSRTLFPHATHRRIGNGFRAFLLCVLTGSTALAEGQLTVSVTDEATGEPTITRMTIRRVDRPGRTIPVRRTVPAGVGVVLDRSAELSMPAGGYRFQMIRGPEYRIITGNFTLETDSLDEHTVALPRMVNMFAAGWVSGDVCVIPNANSLPLRMAAEDLHVAATTGTAKAKPIPRRGKQDAIEFAPIRIDDLVRVEDGLATYQAGADLARRTAIENPFAWQLPVWLATESIDGFFLLGDWLRLDRAVGKVRDGRGPPGPVVDDVAIGRWAERIYWNLLEAGFRIPPLAGGGDQSGNSPVGYNRTYVHLGDTDVSDASIGTDWWDGLWAGRSMVTNGPLLRPRLNSHLPGQVFRGAVGETLKLQPTLDLSTRDPVDYLEVIHNGVVHYSARLDEFAKSGGVIPIIETAESGWVLIRVVTLHEDHFRAAISAPWYIDVGGQKRITDESVDFFRQWLKEHEERLKRLPREKLRPHIQPIRAARKFWAARLSNEFAK